MQNDLLVGAAGAAAFTGLTRRTIYRMSEAGQLPVIRKGRLLFYRKSELERAFRTGPVLERKDAGFGLGQPLTGRAMDTPLIALGQNYRRPMETRYTLAATGARFEA